MRSIEHPKMKHRWRNRILGQDRWRLALLAGLLVVYLLSVLFVLVLPGPYRTSPTWGAFITISTEMDPVQAESLLRESGFQNVVTAQSSDVLVTRFREVETVPLPAALEQLDPLDPRRDAYIEGLPGYFGSDVDDRTLLYVASEQPVRRVSRLVRRALGPGSRVLDHRPGGVLAGLAILTGAAAVALLLNRTFWPAVIAGALPLAVFVIGGGIPGGVAAALVLLVWARALADVDAALELQDSGVPVALVRAGIWIVALVVVSIGVIWAVSGLTAALTLLPALAGLAAVTTAVFVLQLGGSVHRDHDLFAPVSIMSGRARGSSAFSLRSRPAIVAAVVVGLIGIPIAADRLQILGRPAVPRPAQAARTAGAGAARGARSDAISFNSIATLWVTDEPASLVDASDYIAHRAYQQSLAYGRGFLPPTEGETVTLSRFRETDSGAYNQFTENVLTFDSAWLADALDDAPRGITSMILASGRASGVVLTPERGLYSGYPQVLIHTAYVLLALTPAVLLGRRVPQLGRGRSKVVEIARRRKQVA